MTPLGQVFFMPSAALLLLKGAMTALTQRSAKEENAGCYVSLGSKVRAIEFMQ
jgi:hypothetical protein